MHSSHSQCKASDIRICQIVMNDNVYGLQKILIDWFIAMINDFTFCRHHKI